MNPEICPGSSFFIPVLEVGGHLWPRSRWRKAAPLLIPNHSKWLSNALFRTEALFVFLMIAIQAVNNHILEI